MELQLGKSITIVIIFFTYNYYYPSEIANLHWNTDKDLDIYICLSVGEIKLFLIVINKNIFMLIQNYMLKQSYNHHLDENLFPQLLVGKLKIQELRLQQKLYWSVRDPGRKRTDSASVAQHNDPYYVHVISKTSNIPHAQIPPPAKIAWRRIRKIMFHLRLYNVLKMRSYHEMWIKITEVVWTDSTKKRKTYKHIQSVISAPPRKAIHRD